MSDEATAQAILQAERALYQAMIAKDFAALERILSPELVYVHSTAVAENKTEYLAGIAKGWYEYESIVARDATVRVYGDVVLIDGVCDMRVGASGQRKDFVHLLFILVWTRNGGTWRLAHRHATRMPQQHP